MKYLWFAIPLLLSSCTSIRYVTVEHGNLVTDAHAKVNIVGNPPMDCQYDGSSEVFSGFFMYQEPNGTILLDAFGNGIIRLSGSPICTLSYND